MRRLILLTIGLLAAGPAHAGHESPFYPSYYPQEIRVDLVEPAAAAAALKSGKLHAYVGADPFRGAALPEGVLGVESLAGYVVLSPGGGSAAARCATARAVAARLAKGAPGLPAGFRAHPYAVTPFHGDYLQHADLARAAREGLARPAAAAGAAGIEVVPLDDLLGGAPAPWGRAGWYHAYRLQAGAMTDPAARGKADDLARRLMLGDHGSEAERVDLERALVSTLAAGCDRVVAGYVVRREAYSAEYGEGIENVAHDALAGLDSAVFVRTAKLKDFPWNGWLRIGVSSRPAAPWNPVGGFGDPAGRLIWAAVGDPALLPHPYGAGWVPNRVVATEVVRDAAGGIAVPAGALVFEASGGAPRAAGPGRTAKARVRYRVLASLFHDGSRMTLADVVHAYAAAPQPEWLLAVHHVTTERKVLDLGPDLKLEYDVFIVDVYLRHQGGSREAAAAVAPPWTSVPWHVRTLLAAAGGTPDLARDQKAKGELTPLAERLLRDAHVPAPLAGRVTKAEALERWSALKRFFRQHGHYLVANGPYQLASWTPDGAVLQVFRDLSYPLGVGTFDRFAIARRAFITRAEVEGGRLVVTADAEKVFRYQRTYDLVREPFSPDPSAEETRRDVLVCRYVALGPDGRVERVGESASPEGNRFSIDLAGLPGPGPHALLVALYLNGNTVEPDVRVIPYRREGKS